MALEDGRGHRLLRARSIRRPIRRRCGPQLLLAKQKGLKLLCANPDIVVDRGDTREWCAGAMAQLYTEMGGESLYFGKPHPPIYDLARRRLLGSRRVARQ